MDLLVGLIKNAVEIGIIVQHPSVTFSTNMNKYLKVNRVRKRSQNKRCDI
jgi:hypothetical protein